ncbi:hypothetical protein K439DRAFT_1612176 [Ramaria rubella]|nr:hypothetical protein K439DRAFT_1612176 [Ramaria rubella]
MDYIDMCEQLIADRPIHIPSPKREKISPDLSKERNLECEDLERCLQLNVSLCREAHDLQLRDEGNYLNEIVSTTMREVIEDHQPAVNFLDIPSPAGVFPPRFLRVLSMDGWASQRPMGPGFPKYSSKWKLMVTPPALKGSL